MLFRHAKLWVEFMRPFKCFFVHGCLVHFLNNADYASLGTGYYSSPGRGRGEEGRGGGFGAKQGDI